MQCDVMLCDTGHTTNHPRGTQPRCIRCWLHVKTQSNSTASRQDTHTSGSSNAGLLVPLSLVSFTVMATGCEWPCTISLPLSRRNVLMARSLTEGSVRTTEFFVVRDCKSQAGLHQNKTVKGKFTLSYRHKHRHRHKPWLHETVRRSWRREVE